MKWGGFLLRGGLGVGLYKEVREGEKVNPFSVHKWALKTRVQKSGEIYGRV